jgi:hypothetical protein
MLHLKLLENQDHSKSKTIRRIEKIKIQAELNEIETKKNKESMKQKVGSLKKNK